jgi:ketosteroid isomerase-like protein
MQAPDRREGPDRPEEPDTARLADLPVEQLPPDAPDRAQAAVDDVPGDLDPAATARDTGARRDPRAVMAAYAAALKDGDAAVAADLFAENSLLVTPEARLTGRAAIAGWHRDLLAAGAVTASPDGQGNDQGRLEVSGPGGQLVVEVALDASGRIGTARWLTGEQAARPQEERTRTGM